MKVLQTLKDLIVMLISKKTKLLFLNSMENNRYLEFRSKVHLVPKKLPQLNSLHLLSEILSMNPIAKMKIFLLTSKLDKNIITESNLQNQCSIVSKNLLSLYLKKINLGLSEKNQVKFLCLQKIILISMLFSRLFKIKKKQNLFQKF